MNHDKVRTTNARVNPPNLNWSDTKQSLFIVKEDNDSAPRVELIEFELTVTHSKTVKGKHGGEGGLAIQVVKSDLYAGMERGKEDSATNTLKFSVPILFPQDII